MTGHRRISQVFLCAVALTGCSTEHGLYDTALTRPSTVSSEPVTISAPQFYKREDLINERRTELQYLRDELHNSETVAFNAELSRDIETVTALSAQLGLSFDGGIKRSVAKTKQLNDLEDEIAATKLQAQLAQLQRDLQLQQDQLARQTVPSTGASATTSATTVPGAPAAAAPDFTATSALVKSLQDRLEAWRSNSTKISAVDSPIDIFNDRQAYRRVIQSAINSSSLDDLHDFQGHSLFRMQFKAVAKPRLQEADDALALIRMRIKAPKLEDKDLKDLYLEWLDHQTLRLNESIGGEIVPDPTAIAMAANKLFTIVAFYLDRESSDDSHPCESVLIDDPGTNGLEKTVKTNLRKKNCLVVRLALPSQYISQSEANSILELNSNFVPRLFFLKNKDAQLLSWSTGPNAEEKNRVEDCAKVLLPTLKSLQLRGSTQLLALRDASISQALPGHAFSRLLALRETAITCLKKKEGSEPNRKEALDDIVVPETLKNALVNGDKTAVGWVSTYAVTPAALVQHVSTASRASRAVQLAASLTAAIPTSGIGVNSAFDFAHAASAKADALERVPLVVGFSEDIGSKDLDNDKKACNAAAEASATPEPAKGRCATLSVSTGTSTLFGWVLGPKVVIQPGKRKALALQHMLAPYDLTADVVMPGWWPSFTIQYESGWPDKLDRTAYLETLRTLEVPRRHSRGDLDGLTDVILSLDNTRVETANIGSIEPRMVSACSNDVTFLVKGTNIWRTEKAYLYGLASSKVRVLPDMGGVSVTFDMKKLPRRPSGTFVQPYLTLATPVGWASTPIKIDGSQFGEKPCGDEKLTISSGDDGSPSIESIYPASVYACDANPRFIVTGKHLARLQAHVSIGQLVAKIVEPLPKSKPTEPKPSTRKPPRGKGQGDATETSEPNAADSPDSNDLVVTLDRSIGDAGGSSSTLPLIVHTDKGTSSREISVERDDCAAVGSIPRGAGTLSWATIPAGRLDICSSNATVLISGRAATTFDAATLTLDKPRAVTVQAQAAKVVAAQRLLELTFVGIPRDAKPDGGNSATSAKLQLFRKGVKGPALSIDTACGSTVASK